MRIVESGAPSLLVNGRMPKSACKFTNLPFPSGARLLQRCRELWKKGYRSTVLARTGASLQPFASTTNIAEVSTAVWELIYNDIAPLDEDDENWAIVHAVVSSTLYGAVLSNSHTASLQTGEFVLNWRSELGKAAISILVGALRAEVEDDEQVLLGELTQAEAGAQCAKALLEGLHFLYGNPNADVSGLKDVFV